MNGPIAVVAAHPDDEVLGCGATLAKMARAGRQVHVLLLADGETSRTSASSSAQVQRATAAEAARDAMSCATVTQLSMPDNRLDSVDLLDVVKEVEAFLQRWRPTLVFTHFAGDVNVDHRIAHDAVLAATRPQPGFFVEELAFFEIPSSTEWRPPGDLPGFQPNWFVDVSSTLSAKQAALQCYAAELRPFPHPRSVEAIDALARWRGATVGVAAAEAFVLGRRISK
jgi:LmbE family N-acetylglucosaminyl deacetylase